jgi:O-antigen ligase
MTFGLMASLPFLLPLHRHPIASFDSEALAMLLGLLGSMMLLAGRQRTVWQLPPIAWAPLALAAVVAVQAATDRLAYASDAVMIVGMLAWSALMSLAGRTARDALGQRPLSCLMAWCVLAGGVAGALAGLAQYAGVSNAWVLPMPAGGNGIYGNLAQQNHFSTHIALALASACYLWIAGQLQRAALGGLALLFVAALVLSGSRSSFLYLGLITFVTLATLGRPRLFASFALAGAVAIGLLAAAAHFGLLGSQLARLTQFQAGVGPRVFIWRHALEMFAAHPLLGVGFDGFGHAVLGQVRGGERMWGMDQFAHNLVLQLLAVSGVTGCAAVLVPLGLWLRRLVRTAGQDRMWGWCVLGILGIHSMLEQPLYYAYFLGLAAFAAGMMDPAARTLRFGKAGTLLAALALAAALAGLVQTYGQFRQLAIGFYSQASGDKHDEAHQQLLKDLHAGQVFAPMAELLAPELFVPAGASVHERLQFNARLMRFAPVAEVAFRHAALLAEGGQAEAAQAQFERAALAYPAQAPVYLERFERLAASQPATYGPLANHAAAWMRQR